MLIFIYFNFINLSNNKGTLQECMDHCQQLDTEISEEVYILHEHCFITIIIIVLIMIIIDIDFLTN
jgi:hypothetical protein